MGSALTESNQAKKSLTKRKMDKVCITFNLKTTSEKHQLHDENVSIIYESDDDGTAATELMTDDEDQEDDSDVEDCQDYDNTTTNDTKLVVSRNDVETLVESNKIPSAEKERFCDKNVEDDQELFNDVKHEMDLRKCPGQVMEMLKHGRINSCPSMLM